MTEYTKKLVSPDGTEHTARSAREANDLIFGHGYREADSGSKSKAKSAKSDVKTEETA